MKVLYLFILFLFLFPGLEAQNSAQTIVADSFFQPMKFRNIGPYRGGRSVTACGVVGDPLTYYMGTTGGGLWKTEDAGQIWENISDGYFTTGSVGAVAVSESDPAVVYCGMGEHAPRGVMTSYGDGVYKSTDAGKSWKKVGLELSQHIARIVIHPKDPDLLYVAVQGALYGNSEVRGVYRSTDGGENWSQILYVDDHTGCSELSMDMSNPDVLYAAMWDHQRLPWKVISGGPGSGLYKSTDGGESWKKIHKGLPEEKGKMAIAVCRSNPEKVYALIESDSEKEKGGLFVSDNAGKSWSRISKDHRLVQRAWYYIEVFPDPNDANTVYVLSASALRSIDGGKTWEKLSGTHGDYHDLWINPDNSKNLCIANDGGAAISFNYGLNWSTQENMPTAQFYRVNVDNQFPYRIYGGQQDNTSVVIQSQALGRSSIGRENWTYSAGGESAFLAFDPDDPNLVLGGSYLGTIEALHTDAAAGTQIMEAPIQYLGRASRDMKYRFNWNAPIIWSQHEPGTYYHGAQYLLRTRDLGKTWEEVSPDLTRDEDEKQGKGGGPYTNEAVGAENYGTLSYIVESPHEAGVIWTGSDDGLVQLTRDGGETWTNVTPTNLEECLINAIEISPHDPATAYIATTRYKFNDHTPALYKTSDYGKSWVNISKGIPMGAFTRVVREDEERQDLLFCGTETGLYISWNGGNNWEKFQLNLPVVPITDLMIRHGDLVVATMGRSFWILDDLVLLRQIGQKPLNLEIYQPGDAFLMNRESQLNTNDPKFKGSHPLEGVNPANGMVIYYYLPDSMDMTLEVKNSEGEIIRSFTTQKDSSYQKYDGGPPTEPVLSKHKGLNRIVWDLRHATMPGIPGVYIESNYHGHKAIPGQYQLSLKGEGQESTASCQVLFNPLYPTTMDTYIGYDEFMSALEADLTDMHQMVNTLYNAGNQIEKLLPKLKRNEQYSLIKEKGQALIKSMKEWDESMVQRKSKAYDDVENFENKFTANFMFLINQTESDIPRVNQSSRDRLNELMAEWQHLRTKARELMDNQIPLFNQILWEAGVGAITLSGNE